MRDFFSASLANPRGLFLALLVLSGCSVQPVPVTEEEIRNRAAADRNLLSVSRQPITGPISVHEAMARALAYNLDLDLERYKASLVNTELDLARHDQLPSLVIEHNSTGRSNFSGGSSQSLLTGEQSLESSTSSDRYTRADDLRLSWDILDFGVSYYRAQQAADRVLLVEEQQKNVVNRLLTDVQETYWRAVSHDRLVNRLENLMAVVQEKLDESRQIEARGLDTPLTALRYQRELIDNLRELYSLYEGLTHAKVELAFLMNVPFREPFTLKSASRSGDVPVLPFEPETMETLALENRPELREIGYQKRISANEVKAAFVEMLPGINLDYAYNDNSNSFLFNSDWTDYSAQISWNLLGLFRYPKMKALGEAQSATLDAQRVALSGAILTQLHVGVARYQHSRTEYEIASDMQDTQGRILNQVRVAVATDASTEQILIREEMNALLAEVRYDIAYANLEGAYADIYSALGLNPTMSDLDTTSLTTLTRSLEDYFVKRDQRNTDLH